MSKLFKKWNDLNQFHEVTKNLNYPRIHEVLKKQDYKIRFGLKVKLHGTNACVRIEPDGKVTAQKRTSDIGYTPKMDGEHWTDNAGFARWVKDNEHFFSKLARAGYTYYLYGEWCGPGVQKNVACSLTKEKMFYVFAADLHKDTGEVVGRCICPRLLEKKLLEAPDTLLVVPWHSHIEVDFATRDLAKAALDNLNTLVERIGEQDPLMKDLFDIDGAGEGVVAYPYLGLDPGQYYHGEGEMLWFSYFNFKAKSEHHRVNATKTAVQFDPDKFASIQLFADAYCTEARFLQAFKDGVGERKDMRLTPDFIKWVVQDIHKESTTEREASEELDWKLLSKACSTRAVLWYKAKVQEV